MGGASQKSRYAAGDEIARGGMGVILKVKDRDLDRTLAMKRMLSAPDVTGGEVEVDRFARFMEEAHVTAQLDHPAIVPVHDLGTDDDGTAWYTMKLVCGRELGEVIKMARAGDGGWSLPRLIGVLVRVSHAVAYAHAKGVIHRDLKPANIMVGDLGEVYVMDWGLAKQLGRDDVHDIRLKIGDEMARSGMDTIVSPRGGDSGSSLDAPLMTMDGSVVGTPAYMPPEQAAGIVDQVDHLSDIYALGAVLYEVLAAQSPYMDSDGKRSPKDVLTALSNGPPTKVKRIRPEAPAGLVAICEKAMSRQRESRYDSCLDLADDLQAFLDGRVVQAHQTGRWAEFKKLIMRNKATSAAAAVAIVTLLALAVVQAISNRKLGESLANEEAARDEAQNYLAGSYAANAFRHAREGDFDRAAQWFAKAAATTCDPEERADHLVRIAAWSRESFPLVAAFRSGHPDRHSPTFHPSGKFLRASDDDGVAVWDLETEQRIPFGGGQTIHRICEWNPAGDRFVFSERKPKWNRVSVLEWPSCEVVFEIEPSPEVRLYNNVAFGASGEHLALSGYWGFEIWSMAERRRLCYYRRAGESILFIAFDAAGGRLITLNGERQIQVFAMQDLDGGELSAPLFPPIQTSGSLQIRLGDEGREFLVQKGEGRSSWHSTENGEKLRDEPQFRSVIATADEGQVQISGDRAEAVIWGDYGSREHLRIQLDAALVAAAFFPGELRVVTASRSGHVGIYKTVSGELVGTLTKHRLPPAGLAVSSDGTQVAVASSGGLIRVFRLGRGTGSDRMQFPNTAASDNDAALHPGGKIFAARLRSPNEARVIEIDTGEPASPVLTMAAPLLGLEFSPGGETLVALTAPLGSAGEIDFTLGVMEFWDWRAGKRIAESLRMPSAPRSAAFDPNDATRLVVWCAGGQVVNVGLGQRLTRSLLFETGKGRDGVVVDRDGTVAFSPDGSVLAAFGMPDRVYIWDTASKRLRFSPIEVPQTCHDLDFHPDEPIFSTASGTLPAANPAQFWSLEDGTEIAPPIPDSNWPCVGRFVGEGKGLFVLGGRGRVLRTYDWRKRGAPLATLQLEGQARATVPVPGRPNWALSTNGEPGDCLLQLWDVRTGALMAPPQFLDRNARNPTQIDVSGDGGHVLVSGFDVILMRWHIGHLYDPEIPWRLSSLDAFTRFAELRAGSEATDDGGEVDLATDDWIRRWQAFREQFPEYQVSFE